MYVCMYVKVCSLVFYFSIMLTVLLLSQFSCSNKGENTVFHESFGQLEQLRPFWKQGNSSSKQALHAFPYPHGYLIDWSTLVKKNPICMVNSTPLFPYLCSDGELLSGCQAKISWTFISLYLMLPVFVLLCCL